MISKILVVCTGNICRSPMGEGLLQAALQAAGLQVTVYSAGTHALVGRPPEPEAQQVAQALGADISSLRATQLTQALAQQADAILVMEPEHRRWIHQAMPAVRGRVFLYGKWGADEAIPDPYGKPRAHFEFVGQLLQSHTRRWVQWLEKLATTGK